MGFQKFDDLQVPDRMLHCKECDNIVFEFNQFCGNCGRKLKIPKLKKTDWIVKVWV